MTRLPWRALCCRSRQLPRSQAQAQTQGAITPNYKEADLSQIIEAVSAVTGKNFIVDPRVRAQVTMLSSTPMSPAAFYEIRRPGRPQTLVVERLEHGEHVGGTMCAASPARKSRPYRIGSHT